MRECDVLVLPSLEEGSALVTYEARACGCVLAVSDRAGAAVHRRSRRARPPAGDARRARCAPAARCHDDPGLLDRLRDRRGPASARELTWSQAGRVLAGAYADAVAA